MPTCRSCGAPIAWLIMSSGKRAPFDTCEVPFIPDDTAKTIAATPDNRIIRGRTCSESYEAERYVYARLSHFSSCPNAEQHRKT